MTDIISTYFGGSDNEPNNCMTIDEEGFVYMAGHTYSKTNLPLKNAFQSSFGGGMTDGFIVKMLPDLSDIVFATYFGGNNYDEIKDIELDEDGNIWVVGITESSDLPVTNNAFDATYNGNGETYPASLDGFVSKFGKNGNHLYTSYLGGNKKDACYKVLAKSSSTVLIGGETESDDFIFLENLFESGTGFIIELNTETNELPLSAKFDVVTEMALDDPSNIYVCGITDKTDFPLINEFDDSFSGDSEGFLAKINRNGNHIVFSTFIGGNNTDNITNLVLGEEDGLYFSGFSNSTDIACTLSGFSNTNSGENDLIIGRINKTSGRLEYLSYFGGSGTENTFSGCLTQKSKNILAITGFTNSSDFPISDKAFISDNSNVDVTFSIIDINKNKLVYSSYIGGSGIDQSFGLNQLNDSVFYITGKTNSSNFPNAENGYDNSSGSWDNMVCKLTFPDIQFSFTKTSQKFGDMFRTITFSDVDNDDDPDLLSCMYNVPTKVWLNNGKGIFTDSQQSLGSSANTVRLADLNKDGFNDLFIIIGADFDNGDPNQVWLNDSTGKFVNTGQYLGTGYSFDVGLADVDNDGDIDAFVINHAYSSKTGGENKVWLNDGYGNFTDSGQKLGNGYHQRVSMTDIDNDGDIDAVVANGSNWNGAVNENEIWINDGMGKFSKTTLSTTIATRIDAGDLNNDSIPDIIIGYWDFKDNAITKAEVFLNDGAGAFSSTNHLFGNGNEVHLADFDLDGDLDAAVDRQIWLNDGNGIFFQNINEFQNEIVTVLDVDNDSDIDIITGNGELWLNSLIPNEIIFSVDKLNNENHIIKIYPNPTKDMIMISSLESFDDLRGCTYKIYNLNGKIVKADKLTGNSINLNELKEGFYVLYLHMNQITYSQMVLIK